MPEKYMFSFVVVIFLTFSQFGFAQEAKSRDVLIKEAIVNLDSDDIGTAARAAYYLGAYRTSKGVPAMCCVFSKVLAVYL